MSVLIVRDGPGGKPQVLLDGKDITGDVSGLTLIIENGKKSVALEMNPDVVEVKITPDVLEKLPALTKKGGRHA